MIMDNAIDPSIRGALPKIAENAKVFMAKMKNISRDPLKLMPTSSEAK
jgi:hypothetical protein